MLRLVIYVAGTSRGYIKQAIDRVTVACILRSAIVCPYHPDDPSSVHRPIPPEQPIVCEPSCAVKLFVRLRHTSWCSHSELQLHFESSCRCIPTLHLHTARSLLILHIHIHPTLLPISMDHPHHHIFLILLLFGAII